MRIRVTTDEIPAENPRPTAPVPWAWILGLAALGGVLRLWDLGGKPPWLDELFTFVAARRPWSEVLTEPGSPMTPPLYYAVTALFERVSSTVAAMRLPSALFGTGLIVATGVAGVRLGGRSVGILAALLVAVSPFQVRVSQEARMYSLVPLLTVLILLVCQRVLERRRQTDGLLLGLLMAILIAVHYIGVVVLAAVALRFVFEGRNLRHVWKTAVVAIGSAGLLITPLLSMLMAARAYSAGMEIPSGVVPWRASQLWVHFVGYMRALDSIPHSQYIFAALGLLLFLIILSSLRNLLREHGSFGKTLLAFSLVPAVLAFAYLAVANASQITDRTFAFAYPGFVLLLAFAIIRKIRGKARHALVATVVGLNLVTLMALYQTPEAFSRGWSEAFTQIESEGADFMVLPEEYGRMYTTWLERGEITPTPAESVLSADPAKRFPDGVYLLTLHSDKGPARIFGEDRRVLGRLDRAFPERTLHRAGDLRIERYGPAVPEDEKVVAD